MMLALLILTWLFLTWHLLCGIGVFWLTFIGLPDSMTWWVRLWSSLYCAAVLGCMVFVNLAWRGLPQ